MDYKNAFHQLDQQLEMYFCCTGVNIAQIGIRGEVLSFHGRPLSYCEQFKTETGAACDCPEFHLKGCRQSVPFGEPYYLICPLNLLHIAVPLFWQGSFCGGLIAGPILLSNPYQEPELYPPQDHLAPEIVDDLLRSIKQVPIVDPIRTNYLGTFLQLIATNQNSSIAAKQKEKARIESKINEQIQLTKDTAFGQYDLRKREKLLSSHIIRGDYIKARAVLGELLAFIFLMKGKNIENVRSYCNELYSMMSRSALDGGASTEKVLSYNQMLTQELRNFRTTDEISERMNTALYYYCESVSRYFDTTTSTVVKTAIKYINDHYKENIKLTDIANHVHLNPSYFSQLFKNETKVNFIDYVIQLRIEEAKILLTNNSASVLDIAVAVGFSCDSYFCRMFKKRTGITPQKYRTGLGV